MLSVLMVMHFYSRPCGRGDGKTQAQLDAEAKFLLTPLREGRLEWQWIVTEWI